MKINILGYDGNCLSILFELLRADGFAGSARVITNDDIRRSDFPFRTNIDHQVVDASALPAAPGDRFLLGSLTAAGKRFLFDLYQHKWNIGQRDFVSVKHASAVLASSMEHGGNFVIEPLSAVSPYTRLGFAVTVSRNCSLGHHCVLGDFCTINPGVNVCGHVRLGKGVTLGPGTTVFHGVEIGDHSTIVGGSVVRGDIPGNVLAAGNPCRVVKPLGSAR